MISTEPEREEQVRQLASIGLSTRHIARALGDVSQSTVVRILHRADSGPQPALDDPPTSGGLRERLLTPRALAIAGGGTALALLLVLTLAVATLAWG